MRSTAFLGVLALSVFNRCISVCMEDKNKRCPCDSSKDMFPNSTFHGDSSNHRRLLCIDHRGSGSSIFASVSPQSLNLNYRQLKRSDYNQGRGNLTSVGDGIDDCAVVIKIVDKPAPFQSERCPGICKQSPYIIVCPLFLKALSDLTEGSFVMCSLNITTSESLVRSRMGVTGSDISTMDRDLHLGLILKTIAIRRLLECNEKENPVADSSWDYIVAGSNKALTTLNTGKVSQSYSASNQLLQSKRQVYGVVLWVASKSRILLAYNQARVLSLQGDNNHLDATRMTGWIATEDVYPCDHANNKCYLPTNVKCYNEMMPHTYIHLPRSNEGWACGQRRPLRAIAHVLTIYDPDFMLVVDDDTYVNMNLLKYGSVLSSYILTTMKTSRIIMGEMLGYGIGRYGFYYGGSGYLFGRGVITQLTGNYIESWQGEGDGHRKPDQIEKLGILEEAIESSEKLCPKCVTVQSYNGKEKNVKRVAKIGVRVIDMCVNMMAQAGTCYHSDHSFSRCLAHGIYADTVPIRCNGTDIALSTGSTYNFGMCWWRHVCFPSYTITCHRHFADPSDPSKPKSTVRK